ncbi:MAG: beta strand repeat-containing protein, partial [Planctomycetales bacterium]
ALETNVASLDVDNSTSGNINILETDEVTVFDAQQAIAGNIQVIAGGTLTVDNGGAVANAVSTAGSGTITLTALGMDSDLVTNDGVLSDTGLILLTADNDISFEADGDVSSTSGNVNVTADADNAADGGGTDQGSLTMADGAVINAGSGLIDLDANEDILLASVTTTTEVQATSAAGSILDNGDSGADVTAATVALRALTGIGTDANSLDTVSDDGAGSLTIAALTDSGDIHIANTGNLIVGTVDGLSGVTTDDAVAGGDDSTNDNITLTAATSLTVNDDVVNNDGGNILLTASDSGVAGDDLTVATGVSITAAGGSGNITLNAGDNVVLNGTAAVSVAGAGIVTVAADAGSVDAGGAITMADGSTVMSGSGLIDLDATNDVTLGGLVTTGNVTIDTTSGQVLDGGDSNVEVVAATLTVNANGGVGASAGLGADDAIETTIATLNATTTNGTIQLDETDGATLASVVAGGSGDVRIVSAAGDLDVQVVMASGDLVALTATAGSIADASAGEATNITAQDVALRALTGVGDASVDDSDLDLDVDNLAATTTTGDVSLSENAGLTVTTVDGLVGVSITAGGAGDDILIREGAAAGADELRVLQAISNSGTGDITIVAGGDSASDDLDINANFTSGGGDILIVGFDDIDFSTAPTVSTIGTGTITVHAGRTFDFAAGVSAAGTGTTTADILQAAEYTIQTTSGDITLTANQNIELDSISSTSGSVVVTADSDGTSTGAIIDTLAGESANIAASAVALRAAEGIGSADDIDTNVATIAATNSTSGNLQIDNGSGTNLTIGTVDGLAGITNGGGAILVNNLNGTLTVDDSVSTAAGAGGSLSLSGSLVINATVDAGQFDITLNGNDDGDDDLVVNADLTTGGSVALSASRDIIVNATVQTTGAGSDVTATADNDNDGIGGVQITTAGQVNSADAVTLTGSDLFADLGRMESVQIDSDGTTAQVLAAGDITIGPGTGAGAATDVEVDGVVQSTGAGTTITIAANRDVLFGVDGDVTRSDAGASGLISVFSDQASVASTGGVITMADGTVIDGGGGQVEVVADGRLTLGQITTTDLINVGSVAADVIDGGDTGGADLIASSLAIAGETGVGTDADAIETQVSTLSGGTDSGDFHVANTGDLTIDTVNLTTNVSVLLGMATFDGLLIDDSAGAAPAGDNLTVSTVGSLLSNQSIANDAAGTVNLLATTDVVVTAAIDTNGGDITLNSDTDSATSAGGGILVQGVVTSGGGDITLGGGADPSTTSTVAT